MLVWNNLWWSKWRCSTCSLHSKVFIISASTSCLEPSMKQRKINQLQSHFQGKNTNSSCILPCLWHDTREMCVTVVTHRMKCLLALSCTLRSVPGQPSGRETADMRQHNSRLRGNRFFMPVCVSEPCNRPTRRWCSRSGYSAWWTWRGCWVSRWLWFHQIKESSFGQKHVFTTLLLCMCMCWLVFCAQQLLGLVSNVFLLLFPCEPPANHAALRVWAPPVGLCCKHLRQPSFIIFCHLRWAALIPHSLPLSLSPSLSSSLSLFLSSCKKCRDVTWADELWSAGTHWRDGNTSAHTHTN